MKSEEEEEDWQHLITFVLASMKKAVVMLKNLKPEAILILFWQVKTTTQAESEDQLISSEERYFVSRLELKLHRTHRYMTCCLVTKTS